jgi:allantoinase
MRFFDRGGFVRAADFAGYVGDAIDTLLQEADDAPRMLTIGLHTRIIGRPGRIAGLDGILRRVKQQRGRLDVLTRADIARHWLANAARPAG